MKIIISIVGILSFIPFLKISTDSIKKHTMEHYEQEIGQKRLPEILHTKSPITAVLEIQKGTLIAKLTITNTSNCEVIIDRSLLGGDNMHRQLFHLNPWYTSPVLSFVPTKHNAKHKEDLTIIKPNESIVTNTNLKKHFNFNERSYEILSIIFISEMRYLDSNRKQVLQSDTAGILRPVNFYIKSNELVLKYAEDIKPVL